MPSLSATPSGVSSSLLKRKGLSTGRGHSSWTHPLQFPDFLIKLPRQAAGLSSFFPEMAFLRTSSAFQSSEAHCYSIPGLCLPGHPLPSLCAVICVYCVLSCFSRVQLFPTLWTLVRQAPLSMGFSRQEYWCREFPGGPVARTLHSQCRGPGFNPWTGS